MVGLTSHSQWVRDAGSFHLVAPLRSTSGFPNACSTRQKSEGLKTPVILTTSTHILLAGTWSVVCPSPPPPPSKKPGKIRFSTVPGKKRRLLYSLPDALNWRQIVHRKRILAELWREAQGESLQRQMSSSMLASRCFPWTFRREAAYCVCALDGTAVLAVSVDISGDMKSQQPALLQRTEHLKQV